MKVINSAVYIETFSTNGIPEFDVPTGYRTKATLEQDTKVSQTEQAAAIITDTAGKTAVTSTDTAAVHQYMYLNFTVF